MLKSLSRMTIAKKLPLIMIAFVIIACAVTAGIGAYFTFHDAEIAAEKKMLVVAGAKTEMIQSFLTLVQDDIVMTSQMPTTAQAVEEMSKAWSVLPGNPMRYLQSKYMPSNLPSSERVNIKQARDGSEYSALHGKYHPQFKAVMEARNYYDIFLVDMKGNLVYSVYKEADYATNMYTGQWKNTDLANAYKGGLKTKRNDIWISDLAPYEPSAFAPASFLSTPVYSERGKKVGVLIFQLPTEKINAAMAHIKGEEDSALNYLVGADGYLRNNPWEGHGKDNMDVVLKYKMKSDDYKLAIEKNESGYALTDEEGRTVLTGYMPVDFKGLNWAVVVHVDEEEIAEPILKSINKVLMISGLVGIVIAILSMLMARSISNPLKRQVEVMAPLSEGDYSIDVPDQSRGDEVGDIARAVQSFKENGMRVKQLEAEQEANKLKAEEDKKEAQIMLASDFDSRVGGVIESLSESAQSMTAMAQQMQGSSQQTADISNTVAAAATEADSNVQTVAAASEELAASSSEIARQIDAVAKKSSAASADAEETSESVNELNVLADSIGEVIGTIKDIAEQTNLLALNATIEAARAGEAGKGFAVVADEVKKLANETATKTEEIDERVNKIQDAIRNSVTAMDKIISNVSEIDAATTTVASAVEEQNAATAEIGRNVTEASTGTQQVSQSIIQVQQNAAESGEASNTVLHSASELKKQSDILKVEVAKFLNEIRGDAA